MIQFALIRLKYWIWLNKRDREKVCIADGMQDVRPADGVNDAWKVITRWANELAAGSLPNRRNGMRPG